MIKSTDPGRWYCEDCDLLYNECGTLMAHWTAGTAPKVCDRCNEDSCLVIWDTNAGLHRPVFVSIVMSRREAAILQRNLKEGSVYGAEVALELKRQITNAGGLNNLPWSEVLDE